MSPCPLEGWLGDRNTYSASRAASPSPAAGRPDGPYAYLEMEKKKHVAEKKYAPAARRAVYAYSGRSSKDASSPRAIERRPRSRPRTYGRQGVR